MLNYKIVKEYITNNRERILSLIFCVIMFFLGFGTGKSQNTSNLRRDIQPDYTIKKGPITEQAPTVETKPAAHKPDPNGPCLIKGNVSGTNKIYHITGGAFYKRVTPEQCFNTAAEAEAAGFRKSSR